MATKEKFFVSPIDRTPYTACFWLAFLVIGSFILGFILLWNVAGSLKSFKTPHFNGVKLPKNPEGKSIMQQLEDAKKSPSPGVSPTPSLKDQAEKKIQDETKSQIQKKLDETKQQYFPE